MSARLDSNQGPRRYKLRALPTELQAVTRDKAWKLAFIVFSRSRPVSSDTGVYEVSLGTQNYTADRCLLKELTSKSCRIVEILYKFPPAVYLAGG